MSEEAARKKRILSGIQPTGTFTLGNYIGAIRNWAKLQDTFECLYMVADLHALTVRQVPAELRAHTREAAAMLLARLNGQPQAEHRKDMGFSLYEGESLG